MASSHDFFVSGKQDAAIGVIAQALEGEGFTVTATSDGGLLAKRGRVARSLMPGAMAGKKFNVTLTVNFIANPHGRLLARLNRELASSLMMGGVFGAAKADKAFKDCVDAVGFALEDARFLARTR